ncbi:MAG TPA: hypothetical protein VK807_13990 [Gemmatimonadaceae bacterium]|jgi:hypothetical protein|nr:hypothetical protein [Gemmatimonadaceae bacterium]
MSFDPASLDEVLFHASDHRLAMPSTGIRGVEVRRDGTVPDLLRCRRR